MEDLKVSFPAGTFFRLFARTHQPLAMLGSNLEILEANTPLRQMMRWPQEGDIAGRSLPLMLHPDDLLPTLRLIGELSKGGGGSAPQREASLVADDGTIHRASVMAAMGDCPPLGKVLLVFFSPRDGDIKTLR